MFIIVGTYEELVLGYDLSQDDNTQKYKLTLGFTDHSHTGCVKTCAVSTRGILATGSSDESIKLFNLNKKVEIGSLMQHNGAITEIHFHDKTHMFSSSEDGTICVWQVGKWECLKTLKGHKGAVQCFSIHPSGKLALSCGKDRTLRTWNLMTGKTAYISNLKEAIELITWFPASDQYITCIDKKVDFYSIESSGVMHTFSTTFRISCAQFLKSEILILSGDGGDVILYDTEERCIVHTIKTNTIRVKDMTVQEEEGNIKLITASSNGILNVYAIELNEGTYSSKLIVSENTKFRLICVSVMKAKKKELPTLPAAKKILISEEMGGSENDSDDEIRLGDDESDDDLEDVEDDDDDLEDDNDDEDDEEELEDSNVDVNCRLQDNNSEESSEEEEIEEPVKPKRAKLSTKGKKISSVNKKSSIKSVKNKRK